MKMGIRGVDHTIKYLEKTVTSAAKKGIRSGLNKAGTVVAKAQRAAVPVAKTKGHTTDSVKRAIGRKVFTIKSKLTLKVGVGVGKKKGTYRTSAVFLASGTKFRYSGLKDVRVKRNGRIVVIGQKRTGNPIVFRGKVVKARFVSEGYSRTKSQVKSIVNQQTKAVIKKDAAKRA